MTLTPFEDVKIAEYYGLSDPCIFYAAPCRYCQLLSGCWLLVSRLLWSSLSLESVTFRLSNRKQIKHGIKVRLSSFRQQTICKQSSLSLSSLNKSLLVSAIIYSKKTTCLALGWVSQTSLDIYKRQMRSSSAMCQRRHHRVNYVTCRDTGNHWELDKGGIPMINWFTAGHITLVIFGSAFPMSISQIVTPVNKQLFHRSHQSFELQENFYGRYLNTKTRTKYALILGWQY